MNTNDTHNLVLFAGHYPKQIKTDLTAMADELGYSLLPASIGGFKSGERFCELYPAQKDLFAQNKNDIAGAHVHIVMPMQNDPNQFFVDALNTITTIKDYGAENVHVILPFAPYARQDRSFDQRFASLMAKTFPKHLKAAGADQITTFDVHSRAAEQAYEDAFGANNTQFLSAVDILYHGIKSLTKDAHNIAYGAPDGGDKPDDVAQRKARRMTQIDYGTNADPTPNMFFITKRHKGVNTTEVMKLDGDVTGKIAVELDDMVDTGGTLINGAQALKDNGAEMTIAAFTHPILSGKSLQKLTSDTIDGKPNPIDFLIATDSITNIYNKVSHLSPQQKARIQIIPTTPLIKQALTHQFC